MSSLKSHSLWLTLYFMFPRPTEKKVEPTMLIIMYFNLLELYSKILPRVFFTLWNRNKTIKGYYFMPNKFFKLNKYFLKFVWCTLHSDCSPFQKNWRVPWWPLVLIIGTSFHLPKMSWTCWTYEKIGSKSHYVSWSHEFLIFLKLRFLWVLKVI